MERKYIPLTFEQKLIMNVWAAKAPLQMLNMPIRLDIHEKIDEEKFLEAFPSDSGTSSLLPNPFSQE